jgi:putative ABC transport system ATP-binding protein
MNNGDGPVLRARRLRKHYGSGEGLVRALDEVDLDVASGEALVVMGPSGCGKSTLLHLLGGLDRPTAGEMWLNGRRVDQLSERALARVRRDEVGFVFQTFHLMEETRCSHSLRSRVWPFSSQVAWPSRLVEWAC